MNALRTKGTYAGKIGARELVRAKRQPAIKGKRATGAIQPIGLGKAGPGPFRQYLLKQRSLGREPVNRGKSEQVRVPRSGPALGRQLSRRVSEGSITREQAQKTASERRTLKAAFGANWRGQVGQNFGALRRGLAGAKKGDPQYEAANKQAMEARAKALERAKRKLNA